MNELPITIVVTSRMCGHCIHFRGDDGKPTDDKLWSPKLIKSMLTGEENPTVNSKYISKMVVEIHLSNMNIPSDNIIQVNEYNLINLNGKISLRRIIFTRRKGDKISYDVEIDGISYPELALKQKQLYIENQLFNQLILLYNGDLSILKEIPENNIVKSIFDKIKEKYPNAESNKSNDFKTFLEDLYDNMFGFRWWLSKNIPYQIENLVSAFPSWIFVAPSQWTNSILNNSPLYGVVNSSVVLKNKDGNYYSERSEEDEDPKITLQKILNKTYSLYS